ncbi:kinase-like domain-containing protein [Rhizophagus clarus]|uniref:Kinase-like domain-containing protein n=1 Tax=Rhizophagus clarus TaxID=94130 RepID=A0A8H3R2N3_9GLOM|nr:kinase-like domain-containing protein [Rhizophagus clarus]
MSNVNKYFEIFPSEFWSLETKIKAIRDCVRKLLDNKKLDTKNISKKLAKRKALGKVEEQNKGTNDPSPPPKKRKADVLQSPRLFSFEEALSFIPPIIKYLRDCCEVRNSTKVDFELTEEPQFKKYNYTNIEEDVRDAFYCNICLELNKLMKPTYEYTRRDTKAQGISDFNCHKIHKISKKHSTCIFPIEIKRKHILGIHDSSDEEILNNNNNNNNGSSISDLYYSDPYVKDAIKQIYHYMAVNERKYGALSTYNNNWFMYRPEDAPSTLYISETLSIELRFPTVLKTFAYLTLLADENSYSQNPLII